jgi:thioredoxin reductase (NADPH)
VTSPVSREALPADPMVDLAIVGAGPCGLAAGVAAVRAGLSVVLFDRGPIVSGIASYPTYMAFFSTAERLSIGGLPFVVPTEKPTRRDALAYYRMVASHYDLPVRQYETVESVEVLGAPAHDAPAHDASAGAVEEGNEPEGDSPVRPSRFRLRTRTRTGLVRSVRAHAVCVATGYFGRPNLLGVPGEALPHVRHGYVEGHYAWREPVVVVGGGNSAVDAALELQRAEARVQLVHFEAEVDRRVKPWVRPIIENRIADGSITAHFRSRVVAIGPETVTIAGPAGERALPATQVYLMTGYLPETGLLAALGVPIDPESGVPAHDPATMATPVPGVYLAGVIASGFDANRIFIENGRDHGDAIVAHLAAPSSPTS